VIHHHFIYKKHPERYPQQHNFTDCGLFSVKAVIESYFSNIHQIAKKYALSKRQRIIGISIPRQLANICKRYSLDTEYNACKYSSMTELVNFLKNHIQKGPVIILISHAYNKENRYNIIRSFIFQHYISIRGYDDEKEVFYCYDSHTDLRENILPIGNIELPYCDLVSYRKLA
jgi:hypothetical protein